MVRRTRGRKRGRGGRSLETRLSQTVLKEFRGYSQTGSTLSISPSSTGMSDNFRCIRMTTQLSVTDVAAINIQYFDKGVCVGATSRLLSPGQTYTFNFRWPRSTDWTSSNIKIMEIDGACVDKTLPVAKIYAIGRILYRVPSPFIPDSCPTIKGVPHESSGPDDDFASSFSHLSL